MSDPFTRQWDLILGNSSPYTDNDDDYDPTMAVLLFLAFIFGLGSLTPGT